MPNPIFPSSRTDRIRNMLAELVAFDTISDRTNLPLIAHIESYLAFLGVKGERITDETGQKASLWVTIGPEDKPGLVLSGHTDVVPVVIKSLLFSGAPQAARETHTRYMSLS